MARPICRRRTTTTSCRARGLLDANRLKAIWSVNPTFGGPIKQDKLWFFADLYLQPHRHARRRLVPQHEPCGLELRARPDAAGRGRPVFQGRLEPHHLAGEPAEQDSPAIYSYNNTCHCHFLIGRANSAIPVNSEASTLLHIPNKVSQATWSSPVTNRLLLEAGVVVHPGGPAVQSAARVGRPTDHRQRASTSPTAPPSSNLRRLHAGLWVARLGVLRDRQPRLQDRLHAGHGRVREQTPRRVGNLAYTAIERRAERR